jgi:ABC-type phosphate transport system permease subunit
MAPLELFYILLRAPLQLGLALLIGIPMFLFGMFAAAAVDLYSSIREWDDKYWG